MFRRSKRGLLAATTCLALALAALNARAAEPAVLAQVPDDAQVVFVVKDMKALAAQLNNAATRMGIPVPPDLLAAAAQKLGLTKGLDQNGSLAVFLAAAPKEPAAPAAEPPLVILIPTTDGTAMLERFKPKAIDGGMFEVTLPNEDHEETGYAAIVGKHVALAQTKEVLAAYLARKGALNKALSPDALRAFDRNDAVLYANVPLVADKASAVIDEARDGLGMLMAMSAGAAPGDEGLLMQEVLGGYFTGAKAVLSQAQEGLVTLRLNDAGATLGFIGHFKEDSTIGKLIAAQKGIKSPDLTGLPAGSLLLAGAGNWDPTSASAFARKVADEFLASPKLQKLDSYAQLKKAADIELQAFGMLSGTRIALYQPADLSKGWIQAVAIADVSDPAKYQTLLAQAMQDSMMNAASMNPDLKTVVTVKDKALTVKGIDFTKYTTDFKVREATDEKPLRPETEQAAKMIHKMYGPEGMVMYVGPLGPKQMLMVMGGDEKRVAEAVTAAQTNSNALMQAPQMTAAANEALPNALMVAYLPVDQWLALAKKGLGLEAGGREKPATAAAPVAPAVVSVAANGSTMTTEIHVPMSLAISVANSVKDLEGGMMMPPRRRRRPCRRWRPTSDRRIQPTRERKGGVCKDPAFFAAPGYGGVRSPRGRRRQDWRKIPLRLAMTPPMSPLRTRVSPTRSERTPAALRRWTSARSLIPLSATSTCLSSTNSARRRVVLRSTWKVRRSRLLMPSRL